MNIIVIGGGAAGMMAALAAARQNPAAHVFLLEKNEKLGKKIFITGKGRGNLTNARPMENFFSEYLHNARFLYPAFRAFTNQDLMRLVEKGGCRLKEERGGRVFPVSDHAYSITDALKHELKKAGVNIAYNTKAVSVEMDRGAVRSVKTNRDSYRADRVIVCCGGMSYPSTGSDGDGYRIARSFGIEVTKLYPSLVGFEVLEPDFDRLSGLKLKNICLRIKDESGKCYAEESGELYFMRDLLEGPTVLRASAAVTSLLNEDGGKQIFTASIDLKPSVSAEELDVRVRRETEKASVREIRGIFREMLPMELVPVFSSRLERRGVDLHVRPSELTREGRRAIVGLMKDFSFTIRGTGNFRQAIVTQGGIKVSEINPRTMESRKVPGLYFAGEVLDVDGYTGGFNMQAAFSTGYLAGISAAGESDQ